MLVIVLPGSDIAATSRWMLQQRPRTVASASVVQAALAPIAPVVLTDYTHIYM